jgi:MFS family permease
MPTRERLKVPRILWVLFGGLFINRFGDFVSVFLVLYLISRGSTPGQAGAAASLYGLGSLAASLVGGYCADHLGRRSTMLLSAFSSAVIVLLLAQVMLLSLIIPLVALAGLAAGLYRPASAALIADLIPPGERVRVYALSRFSINLGSSLGPALAGLLAGRSFLLIFLGDALTSIIFGLLILMVLPADLPAHLKRRFSEKSFFKSLSRDSLLLLFLPAFLMAGVVYFQNQSSLALQVHAAGLSPILYGMLLSLNGFIVVLLELPISTVTQRLPAAPVIAVGILLIGLGFGLLALASTLPLLIVSVVLWTLGEIVLSPVAAAYMADLAPPHLRGRYQGIWGLTWGSGLILGPLLGALVFSWSPRALWLACAALGLLAAALVLVAAWRGSARGVDSAERI